MNASKTALAAVVLLAVVLATFGICGQQGPADADEPSVAAGGTSLTTVYIPETATSISAGAFIGCENLEYVTIPSSVTSIGAGAFSGCDSLRSITFIGDSDVVLKGDSMIFEHPYDVTIINATNGKTVTLSSELVGGNGIAKAETGAAMVFYGGSWYEAYMFTFDGDSISKITWKSSYRGTLVIPSSADVICNGSNNQLFDFNKDWVEEVAIPSGVTAIGNNAFSGCTALKSAPLPPSITSIGRNAFSGCSSLASIELPENLRTIGEYAFLNCIKLTEMTIPEGVSDISGAFQGCSNLKSVSLPYKLQTIGEYAFMSCRSLSSIEIHDGIEEVSDYAFFGCSSLTSVILPESVVKVGERAFESCSSLTSAKLSEGLESLGSRAFAGCSAMTSITIPASVGEIGKGAFSNCTSLKSIDIERRASLTIGEYAFPQDSVLSVDFYSENGTLLATNYYKHGTFEYKTLPAAGFYRTAS